MKKFLIVISVLLMAMACEISHEDQIDLIKAELDEKGISEFCQVSIGTLNGETAYIIGTNMVVREDNFYDCFNAYATVMGCVGRAVESDDGYLRVVTESLYIDMPMDGVHSCLRVASEDGDAISEMDKYMEWVDR